MNVNIFKAVGELAIGAKRRTDKDYADFLAFYRELVETLPIEVTDLFGTMNEVWVKRPGVKDESVGLELNVADLIWWQTEFKTGSRFLHGIEHVKAAMLRRLTLKAETQRLTPAERKSLLALVDQATA